MIIIVEVEGNMTNKDEQKIAELLDAAEPVANYLIQQVNQKKIIGLLYIQQIERFVAALNEMRN